MTIDKRGESMPGFSYVAVDKRGKEKRGSLEAETRERALEQLKAEGLIPVSADIKSKIRQISVARAIGANNGILFRTLSVDALKKTISGYIIGFSLSAILVIVFVVFSPQSTIPYLPYIDLLIYPFAVITIISVVNLLAVFTAIRAIRKTDIYTAMARNVF